MKAREIDRRAREINGFPGSDRLLQPRMSKKAYRKIKTYVAGAKKDDTAINNPFYFQTPFRLDHNHFIATSHRGEMLAQRLKVFYDT